MRVITVERGFDPRDFALLAFGGAGPMHACELALDLGIRHVVLPRNPGLACAWGALQCAARARILAHRARDGARLIASLLARVRTDGQARARTRTRGARACAPRANPRRAFRRSCAIADNPTKSRCRSPRASSPISTRRITAPSATPRPTPRSKSSTCACALSAPGASAAPERLARARNGRSRRRCAESRSSSADARAQYRSTQRDELGAGARIRGPAIVVELSATAYVAPDFTMRVDDFGNLHLET